VGRHASRRTGVKRSSRRRFASSRLVDLALKLVGRPLAALAGLALRWSAQPRGIALVYHQIDDATGDPTRTIVATHGASLFESQVRYLKGHYRVVPASELIAATAARRRGERFPVAITFDDDLRSHTRRAMPILGRVGVPATFFVSGASLAAPFSFWWERLQRAIDQGVDVESVHQAAGGEPPDDVRTLASRVIDMSPAQRDALSARLRERLGPDPEDAAMRADDLRALAQAGFQIGFHTLRHEAMTGLDEDGLQGAMQEGREQIEEVVGRRLTTISYPHGRADERVASAARAAGYEWGFVASPLPVRPATDPLLIGRIGPSVRSTDALAVRILRTLLRRG
jgi:peptidoglycan/xylan/chitin deacetylase (PgdA/CDA1 family)